MQKRDKLIWPIVLLAALLPLLVACGSGAKEGEVTIKCDDCEVVKLWETSHATRVVGEVKPGDTGTATDKAWSALEGCMFYYVLVGDQEGWICDKYLEFR
jgi:hypothetical protein